MKNFLKSKFLNSRNLKKSLFLISFIFVYTNINSQTYPDEIQLSSVNYQAYQAPTETLPGYLEPFTESLSGSTITRVSDKNVFGTNSGRIRHNYAKDQTWNSDGSLLKLAGYPAAILDGETYEFLYWSNIPSYGRWANTEANYMYGTPQNRFVKFNVQTNTSQTLHTFNDYASIDFGFGEGNQSNDDQYVGIIGRNGTDNTLIVYDILNDQITGTMFIGSQGNLDWFSVSQSGDFAVACWGTQGSGSLQGVKTYDRNFNNERHVADYSSHGDLGYDTSGNEVFVGYHGQDGWDAGYYLYSARLDGGGLTNLFNYPGGIWGGHISCRNIDRPGWAYVSEQCCTSHDVASREIFAIKLDDSGIIERYTKHHNDVSPGNGHSTEAVPNRDGTKILFASNWNSSNVMSDPNPPAWVLAVPQGDNLTANAGVDTTICQGESTTLTASGGNSYQWSTGETSASISVNPNITTTYSVTVSDGNTSDSDDVIVNVNALPNANAGADVTIAEGESTTLTASGGNNYQWSTGETTQSITVSPTNTTSYTATVFQGNCSNTDTVEVSVNAIVPVTANAGVDTTICQGENTTLTASGGNSYQWSTGETSASISVNPNITTTYSVTVSDGNTSDSDDVIVNVNALPNANAGLDVSITEGESTILTASGGNNYQWSTGETTQSITVSPTNTTSYTVTVFQGNCSNTDTVEVSVNAIVPVTANAGVDTTICQGENTTLTASGGNSYQWSTGETSASISVNPNITTTYSVTVSDGNTSDSDDVIVNVNPSPIIDAGTDIMIETGQSLSLSASGGNSYQWSTGQNGSNISVSPTETTTYTVTGFINNCSSADEVIVTVVQPVNADAGEDVLICRGESVILTAYGGTEFLWDSGETTPSIYVNPLENTTYSVSVSNGLNSQSDSVDININEDLNACPGLSNGEETINNTVFEFNVYPNPTQDQINIKFSGLFDVANLQLYDMLGRSLINDVIQPHEQGVVKTLSLGEYPRGVYLLALFQNGNSITKRIVLH